ncbi:MAG: L-sorbosone dehydrogenase [Acidobacteriaceae bacterium]|nr:L-sorbosone dehydrogenase [Acidobacteriaceae bacterium]
MNLLRRTLGALALCVVIALVVILALNVGGWRALVQARLLRTENQPIVVPPPPNFEPQVPSGFRASIFATGFTSPRWLAVAPNGDVFVADSAANQVIVLRNRNVGEKAESREIFAEDLNLPFGIAFHDDSVYIANTNEVVRFRYDSVTSKRLSGAEHILDLPGGGYHQHWTRSLAFSPDGKQLFVSIGSRSNVAIESDPRRAAILVADADGKNSRIYASGLRNAVGIAFNSESNELWSAVNERDDIGDDVPQDYFTHVIDGAFYGWPYVYEGGHVDGRVTQRPDLAAKTIAADMPLGAHVAPLQFAFYEGNQFPPAYRNGAFIAEHGSWNRRIRNGYQVVFVTFQNGRPTGKPASFFSGFVPDPAGKNVYGRMVGVAIAKDGSLLISDDGANVIWRVSYQRQ